MEAINQRTYLNVPRQQWDFAKSLGVSWDPKRKLWFFPPSISDAAFEKGGEIAEGWQPFCIEPTDSIFVVTTTRTCYKCGKETPVAAFGAPYASGGEFPDSLMLIPRFTVTPKVLVDIVNDLGVNFGEKYSQTTGATKLNNMCVHCGALQGEFFMFHEPKGEFFPTELEDLEKYTFNRLPFTNELCFYHCDMSPLNQALYSLAQRKALPYDTPAIRGPLAITRPSFD